MQTAHHSACPHFLALWLRKPRLEAQSDTAGSFTPRAGSPPPPHRGRVPLCAQSFPSSHVPSWRERRENIEYRGTRTEHRKPRRDGYARERRMRSDHAGWPRRRLRLRRRVRRHRVPGRPAPAGRAPSLRVRGRGATGGDARGSALLTLGSWREAERRRPRPCAPDGRGAASLGAGRTPVAPAPVPGRPMSRGTMPQPGAWPGVSCAEKPAREAGPASPGPARAAARDGGKASAGGQPRAAVRCPAEQ